ncbi:hypothetical protein EC991_003082 [Linnemannia zychae]|nr:hypothetical protein EC991_003082 [Linnemannia zychae]
MHRFPRESGLATAYCAYFVSYLICDLGLGMVYYPDFVDPLSGWAHHLFYLGIMSLATAQGNISTLFAMGTPIEVSTIFLATGHIFPTLRSDVVFATSFLFARILYPIALLPELILNVESRLCWKVGAMALSVHVYWFYKFIQQQLRYYHARQEQKQQLNVAADVKVDGQSTTATVAREEESLKIQTVSEDRKSTGIVCESGIAAAVTVDKSVEAKTPESPTAANEMFGTGLSAIPSIQVNSSRHRRPRVVRLPSGQSIASLASFQPPTEDSDNAATPAVTITPPAITISSSATIVTAAAVTAVTTPTTKKAPKTMKELLEECSDEDISTYKFPIHSNKTLSVLARKPSNDSQGIFGSGRDLGVVRLSRASSMRDSKRRIALGAVQFACPSSSSSSLTVGEPKANKEEEEPCSVKNGEVEAVEGLKKNKTMNRNVDADATVVMRPRRASPSRDGDYGFGTVRGGVVAVNA